MTPRDPFERLGGDGGDGPRKGKFWTIVMPVPSDAPSPPVEHFKLGKPSARWTYLNSTASILGYVQRFDGRAGEKEFRPLTLWADASGKMEWRWESWPSKRRPLYGLQRLAESPSALVVVTEGEKASDAATELLPDVVVVTSPNGSKSATKADWSPLRGRIVVIWPDADVAGHEYADTVAKCVTAAGAKSVAIISPPAGVAAAWDAADARDEKWSIARTTSPIPKAGIGGARRNATPSSALPTAVSFGTTPSGLLMPPIR
jgi:putative DNA primase/helicase